VAAHSFDAGEQLSVVRDAGGALLLRHGARHLATLKQTIGGGVRLEADGRSWRLSRTEDGWTAAGDPPATFARRRLLPGDRLTIGDTRLTVRGRTVKGPHGRMLRFAAPDRSARTPAITARIGVPPPQDADATAIVALATAAVVLDADLSPAATTASLNGDNVAAAVRYGHH
jgi:hypothetical protein